MDQKHGRYQQITMERYYVPMDISRAEPREMDGGNDGCCDLFCLLRRVCSSANWVIEGDSWNSVVVVVVAAVVVVEQF